jgi:hypothetical protein
MESVEYVDVTDIVLPILKHGFVLDPLGRERWIFYQLAKNGIFLGNVGYHSNGRPITSNTHRTSDGRYLMKYIVVDYNPEWNR